MKTIKKLSLGLLLLAGLGLLSGCMPGNFTSKHKDEITKQYKDEAKDWFSANLPEAHVNSAAAYATGTDLFAAITGTYDLGKKTYTYLYDYDQDIMYLGQELEAYLTELARLSADALGVSPEQVTASTLSYPDTGISVRVENDSYSNQAQPPADGMEKILRDDLLPAGTDPAAYAAATFAGEQLLYSYSLKIDVNEIPEYSHQVFDEQSNLSFISYKRPIDWDYEGIYYAVYYDTFATVETIHLRELDKDLYGGYFISEKLYYDENADALEAGVSFEDKINYEAAGSGEFHMEIPENTTLLLFSKGGKYYDQFQNSQGKTQENKANELGKSDGKGLFDGYDIFDACIILPKSSYKGYSLEYMRKSEDGTYTIISK